ncbi:MAG: hypothetical protein WC307_03345 [Candidatus Nanoarchaeia archaeon]|jgi:hypothetical protein
MDKYSFIEGLTYAGNKLLDYFQDKYFTEANQYLRKGMNELLNNINIFCGLEEKLLLSNKKGLELISDSINSVKLIQGQYINKGLDNESYNKGLEQIFNLINKTFNEVPFGIKLLFGPVLNPAIKESKRIIKSLKRPLTNQVSN